MISKFVRISFISLFLSMELKKVVAWVTLIKSIAWIHFWAKIYISAINNTSNGAWKMQKSMLQVINIVVQSTNRLVEDKCVANSNHIRTQYFSASFLLLMKRPPDLPAGTKSLVSGKKLQNVLESQGKPSTYKWNYLKISNNKTNYFIDTFQIW